MTPQPQPQTQAQTHTLHTALTEAAEWIAAVNYEQAIVRCNELLAAYPDAVRVLRQRAQAYEMSGDSARAMDDYVRVLEIMPLDVNSLVGLARCQLAAGQASEATVSAAQALDFDPHNTDARQMVGAEDEEQATGAQPTSEQPASKPAISSSATLGAVARARAWLQAGLTNRALTEMRRLQQAQLDRADLQTELAAMLWRSGLKIVTIELCQTIVDDEPDCLPAHVMLSQLWAATGNTGLAELHQRAVERSDPDYRETNDWLGAASPFSVHDAPAQVEAPTPPDLDAPDREQAEAEAEEERDRSAWVNDLIYAGPPARPVPTPTPAPASAPASDSPRPPAARESDTDLYSGEIVGTTPLQWAPALQGEGAGGGQEEADDTPPWLVSLQAAPAPGANADTNAASVSTVSETLSSVPAVADARAARLAEWLPLVDEPPAQHEQAAQPITPTPGATEQPDLPKQPVDSTADPEPEPATAATAILVDPAPAPAPTPASSEPDPAPTVMEAAASVEVTQPPPSAQEDTGSSVIEAPAPPSTDAPADAPAPAPIDATKEAPAEVATPVLIPAPAPASAPRKRKAKAPKAQEGQPDQTAAPAQPAQIEPSTQPAPASQTSPPAQPTVGDRVALARQALAQARYAEAAEHYTALISAGKRLDPVLADLDAFTQAHPDQRDFFALLGDAHARKGNVDAALMAYHRAWEE